MHAHTTLALSLSAALAYAGPAHNYNSTTVHNYNETVHKPTTLTSYVLTQETHTVHAVPSHAPKDQHVADERCGY